MLAWIAGTALVLAIASFVVFVRSAASALRAQEKAAAVAAAAGDAAQAKTTEPPAGGAAAQRDVTFQPDLEKLLVATKDMLEVIVKAGPGLAGLVASVSFLVISAWAAAKFP